MALYICNGISVLNLNYRSKIMQDCLWKVNLALFLAVLIDCMMLICKLLIGSNSIDNTYVVSCVIGNFA